MRLEWMVFHKKERYLSLIRFNLSTNHWIITATVPQRVRAKDISRKNW